MEFNPDTQMQFGSCRGSEFDRAKGIDGFPPGTEWRCPFGIALGEGPETITYGCARKHTRTTSGTVQRSDHPCLDLTVREHPTDWENQLRPRAYSSLDT